MATVICAVEKFAGAVKVEAPRIATPFAEQFEFVRNRVISPDSLLKFNSTDIRGDGAPLTSVKPAIGTPCQRIGDAMRILHPESGQQNFRITIRNVVSIKIGIEQQVGDI